MRDLMFEKLCNAGKLDAEIRTLIGAKLLGVSTGANTRVYLNDTATPADDTTVTAAVAAHDATPIPDPDVVALATAKAQAGSTPIDGLTVTAAIAYIQANVTDLPTAKTALIILVKYIGIQERRLRLLESKIGL